MDGSRNLVTPVFKAARSFQTQRRDRRRLKFPLYRVQHAHRCIDCLVSQSIAMAHPVSRLFSRRFCQLSTPFPRVSNSLPRGFRAPIRNSPARRKYARPSGEKGPNPIPGQSPFKLWPFIAITLAGSATYVLMVRSRIGMNPFSIQALREPL